MAKTISEEELQLRKRARRRLIGAIALVTIVAVFIPMVLDHDPKPISQDVSIRIPAPNSSTFTSKIVPVVPASPDIASSTGPASVDGVKGGSARSESVAAAPPAYDTEAAPPKPASADRSGAEKAKSGEKSAAVAVTGAKSSPAPRAEEKAQIQARSSGGFVVQVAALTDAGKAKEMQQRIAAAGVKTYTEIVPTAKGNVTRVRAGPFAGRDEAERVRDKLKDMGLGGNVVPK
jgi:DedD protein